MRQILPPLSEPQRNLVAAALGWLQAKLLRDYDGCVERLGWDDAYAEACLACCRAAVGWAQLCPFEFYAAYWVKAYLFGACLDKVRWPESCDPDVLLDESRPPDRDAQLRLDAADALAVLPPHYRQYATLAAAGYTQAEIGRRIGCKRPAVAKLKSRVLRRAYRLRRSLVAA